MLLSPHRSKRGEMATCIVIYLKTVFVDTYTIQNGGRTIRPGTIRPRTIRPIFFLKS